MNGEPVSLNNVNGRVPGREVLPSGAPKRFLTFSAFILLLTILLYVGLSFGYKAFLNNEIEDLNNSLEELRFEVPPEEQDDLVSFFSQVGNIDEILNDHIITSNLFPILERNTHRQVAYRSMDVSTVENKVTLDGVAANYDALVSQLAIYESVPEIQRVVLNSSQRDAATVNFSVVLTLDKSLFAFEEKTFNAAPVDATGTIETE